MSLPMDNREVWIQIKGDLGLTPARFCHDAPMPHWRKANGHPLSNCFVGMSDVESWREIPKTKVNR